MKKSLSIIQGIISSMSEHEEQVALFEWARYSTNIYPELEFMYAIPNGAKLPYIRNARGNRFSPQALKLKAEGLHPGIPDICLPCARGAYHALYIELKAGNNKPTAEQRYCLDGLNNMGNLAVWCIGADNARLVIETYLRLPPGQRFTSNACHY